MEYNYYLEGYSNGIFLRKYISAKTIRGLENKRRDYEIKNRLVDTGYVLFTFSGSENRKYDRNQYKILDQFNAKAFFEFWA